MKEGASKKEREREKESRRMVGSLCTDNSQKRCKILRFILIPITLLVTMGRQIQTKTGYQFSSFRMQKARETNLLHSWWECE